LKRDNVADIKEVPVVSKPVAAKVVESYASMLYAYP
jgi:hypothetical protein